MTTPRGKTAVFISHAHEESPVSLVLQQWIAQTLLDRCDVFVSSDDNSLLPGQKWLQTVFENLQQCDLLVIVCGPDGYQKPWINFEAGAAWIRDLPVIPLCHSGLLAKTLPLPLSIYQAIELVDAKSCRQFMQRMAVATGLSHAPAADYDEMWRTVLNSLRRARSLAPRNVRPASIGLGLREAFSIGAGIGNLMELVPLDEGPRKRLESFLDHLVDLGLDPDGPVEVLRQLAQSLRQRKTKSPRLTAWERKAAVRCIDNFGLLGEQMETLFDQDEFRWFNFARYLAEARNSLKYGVSGDLVSSVAILESVAEVVEMPSRLRERVTEFIKMATAKDVNGVDLADGIIRSAYLSLK